MKKTFLLLAAIIGLGFNAVAQSAGAQRPDLIITKAGENIEAKITKIGLDEVEYKKFDNQEGPNYALSKCDIASIVYANGKAEVFDCNKKQSKVVAEKEKAAATAPMYQPHALGFEMSHGFSIQRKYSNYFNLRDSYSISDCGYDGNSGSNYVAYGFDIGIHYTWNFSPYVGWDVIKLKFSIGNSFDQIGYINILTGIRASTPRFNVGSKKTYVYSAFRLGGCYVKDMDFHYDTPPYANGHTIIYDKFGFTCELDLGLHFKRLFFGPKYSYLNHKHYIGFNVGVDIEIGNKKPTAKVERNTIIKEKVVVRDTVIIREVIREVPQDIKQTMVELSNALFAFDKFTLNEKTISYLNKVVNWLKQNPEINVEIEGHTDNKGTAEYNQQLSEERAKAVYDYFVKNGISASRLSYNGYGLTRPIADNATEAGRQQNRRVELKIINN